MTMDMRKVRLLGEAYPTQLWSGHQQNTSPMIESLFLLQIGGRVN